jgi:hypothetical protein
MDVPKPFPEVTDEDVRKIVTGLKPGAYSSAVLFERYVEAIRPEGREPVHPIALGKTLARLGYLRRYVRVKGRKVNAWII